MLVLGLTGNIGCGKSSVSTIFMNHGIEIVDADIVARHIFEDLDLLNKVFSTFGETIKNEDGSLNRKALGNIAIDAALLIEDNYLPYIDKLILVTCKKDIQIKRIIARDNCTEKEAISRINSQMSQEDKAKFADYIIDNSGSFENLEQQVLEIISVLQGE